MRRSERENHWLKAWEIPEVLWNEDYGWNEFWKMWGFRFSTVLKTHVPLFFLHISFLGVLWFPYFSCIFVKSTVRSCLSMRSLLALNLCSSQLHFLVLTWSITDCWSVSVSQSDPVLLQHVLNRVQTTHKTRQDSLVLSVSVVWTRHWCTDKQLSHWMPCDIYGLYCLIAARCEWPLHDAARCSTVPLLTQATWRYWWDMEQMIRSADGCNHCLMERFVHVLQWLNLQWVESVIIVFHISPNLSFSIVNII